MRISIFTGVLFVSTLSAAYASTSPAASYISPDAASLTSNFTVGTRTVVPGTTLKPGSYVIRIVDHLSDRTILSVERPDGKVLATFLALPSQAISRGGSGPVDFSDGPKHDRALRGYSFPGNLTVEFVYPKAEAVQLAIANGQKVEAIDPASDNLPSKEKNLSHDDMQIVTLWTLSPTVVPAGGGLSGPAISAAKYVPPSPPQPSAPRYVARNEPPANMPNAAPFQQTPAASIAAPRSRPASATRKPVLAVLPHTASDLPMILMLGLLAFIGAVMLRLRSVSRS
jgi:hypothetical protein